jgi:hypothetical protein
MSATKQPTTQLIEVERSNTALTPMGMLEKAITSGATVEVMEKLMALQERWEANQARKAFDNAMADAKAEIPVIIKNQSVGYDSKSGGRGTSYMHEDMAQIARTIDPIIAKHGLSYRFRTTSEAARVIVTCVVSHRDGHSEENSLSSGHDGSGGKNAIQGLGSALTYLQRYSLKAAFGLAAAVDDDGRMSAEISQRPTERSRVPSPSDAPALEKAIPEPPQGPQLVKGGKDAASWAKLYIEALLTSDSPETVMQWIDANQNPLSRISKDEAKKITVITEKHLAFLRKTAPKEDPISSGIPKSDAMPNIDRKTGEWMVWAVKKNSETDAGDEMDALFESFDAFWMDLLPLDRDALLAARKTRETELEP